MTDRPVFVLMTAENCGHCIALKKNPDGWNAIEQELNASGLVRVVKVELPTTDSKAEAGKYPSDINRYLRWFPSAALFSGSNWNEAMTNPATKLNGIILSGDFDASGVPQYKPGKYLLKKGSTLEWVKENVGSLHNSRGVQPLVPNSFNKPLINQVAQPKTIYVPTAGSVCGGLKMIPNNR